MWDISEKYSDAETPGSRAEWLALDEARFRACFRTFFYGELLPRVYGDAKGADLAHAKELLALWRERGLSEGDHDLRFARCLVQAVEEEPDAPLDSAALRAYRMEKPAITPEDREVVLRVIHDRRSVRAFFNRDIPDELIAKILAAGQHAAHVNNLQSIRYIVVNETHEPWVFRGVDIPPAHQHIAVLQDDRCYLGGDEKSQMDRIIDAGAATECMLLAMHAYGVDGAWLTYNDEEQFPRLRAKFDLPEYIRIVDLIDLGYGSQTPFPPQRPEVDERVIVRV